jgi:uncharacterized membrane protein YcgQ (UPF0703/DUF1980 family)
MVRSHKNNSSILILPLLLLMIIIPWSHAIGPPSPPGYTEYTQLVIGNILFDATKASVQELLSSKIFIQGKVWKSSLLKNDEIIVYRMAITCCAADALPFGILVKIPKKSQFHDGDWVGVQGTIQLLPFNEKLKTIEPVANMVPLGDVFPYFTAVKAYKVNAPSVEYLYY